MAVRKKRTSKPSAEAEANRFVVLLEQMQEQNRATIEAVHATKNEIIRRMDDFRSQVEMRLSVLEAAVRRNSEDIRKNSEDIRKNSEDIEALRRQVERLTVVVSGKADTSELAALEARVALLEKRLGIGS